MAALRKPVFTRMTAPEFIAWRPEERADHRWQLIDGEPVCMAPASENHGRIQAEASFLLTQHLRATRPGCSVVITPGVNPRVRSDSNFRIPDLGVTCGPPTTGHFVTDPVLLLEILSPSNQAETRANVWAYATIPSVVDILLLSASETKGELLTRLPGASWPAGPILLSADDEAPLASIGLTVPLRAFYRTTSLAIG